MKRLRQFFCSHHNTTEEWTEVDRQHGIVLDTVTRLRTLWRCEDCGKEVRQSRKVHHIGGSGANQSDTESA